ncbi:hypothetical protein BaRGS_00005220, partial [Batillaria attramentaria]
STPLPQVFSAKVRVSTTARGCPLFALLSIHAERETSGSSAQLNLPPRTSARDLFTGAFTRWSVSTSYYVSRRSSDVRSYRSKEFTITNHLSANQWPGTPRTDLNTVQSNTTPRLASQATDTRLHNLLRRMRVEKRLVSRSSNSSPKATKRNWEKRLEGENQHTGLARLPWSALSLRYAESTVSTDHTHGEFVPQGFLYL